MEDALLETDTSAAQLDTGVANKLKKAALALGPFSVPVGSAPVNGMKWGMLAQQGQLSRAEYLATVAWLEEAWSEEMSKRMLGAISVLSHASLPSAPAVLSPVAAPLAVAPQPPAAMSAPAPSPTMGLAGTMAALSMGGAPASTATATPAVTATAALNLTSDLLNQPGLNEGDFAPATFALHTAHMPPSAHAEIKYGSDVVASKPYRNHATNQPTLLKLCEDKGTTMAAFNQHFLRVADTLRQAGLAFAADRLTSAWMEKQNALSTPRMLSLYPIHYLRKYPGRFLPILLDQVLVQKVMVMMLTEIGEHSSANTAFVEQVAAMRTELTALTAAVDSLKSLRSDLGSLKAEVAEVKKSAANTTKCAYCGALGHIERNCHKKKADLAAAAQASGAAT